MFMIKLIMLVFMTSHSVHTIPINSLFNYGLHRTLSKRALSYIANETVCIIDNLIYQNGDPIPTDDPCESCKCRPPGYACVLRECEVKPGCKEIAVEGECCPTYQCGCEHNGKMYNDGEIVPNPNKLLKCYKCRCRGSSIICGLMDCQYRFDCQSRYEPGECCPNYEHCIAHTSTEQTILFDNQTDTSINTASSLTKSTTSVFKANSMLTDLFSPDQTKQTVVPSSFISSMMNNKDNQQTATTTQSFTSLSTEGSSTILPFTIASDQNENADDELSQINPVPIKVIINNSLDSNKSKNEINQLDKFNDDDIKQTLNQTAPVVEEGADDEMMISNIRLNKIVSSSIGSNEVTPLISNRLDQIEKRIDETIVDAKKIESEKEDKNEILDETVTILPISSTTSSLMIQALTTSQSLIDSVPSSTTIETDTTILAPNTSSIINSITQSPIMNSTLNDSKDYLKDNRKDIKNNLKDEIRVDLNKKIADSKESFNNDSSVELNKDELNSEIKNSKEEENMIKKLEAKLEEKIDDDKIEPIEDELKTPIDLLKKVLDKCTNGRCNSLDLLIKVTEDVLSELDPKVIEKVKLSDAFEQLKTKLITINSSTIVSMAMPTDSPTSNLTESSLVQLEENFPTTVRFVKTSDLNAEHKDSDVDDLELEDLNKTYQIF